VTDASTLIAEMEKLYLDDKRPWIIGFSGGKDSTCIVQMVYYMLKALPPDKRTKKIHILSSDTLVESPVMEIRRREICEKIENQAKKDGLLIEVEILTPKLTDTFWVNLIGRGYPSPNRWFRWCTDRLKIRPMTKYILEQVKENGEVILLLGLRRSESATRSQAMNKYEIESFRLRKHATIQGAYIYAPIENWKENDVWEYLLKIASPWSENNEDLMKFYGKGDTEVQFIIDKSSPPSGTSRFGCWVCTVVKKDRALEGFIEEGEEWLKPLLEFRNWLKEIRDNPECRESIRKKDKKKQVIASVLGREFTPYEHRGYRVLGPFTFETRHKILKRLINLQEMVADRGISLVSPEELKAIETLWIYEGDPITSIVDVLGPSEESTDELPVNDKSSTTKLEEICSNHGISVQLIEQLLAVERDFSSMSRRSGIYGRLEKVIEGYVIDEMSNRNGEINENS
jgi:DNA sulfur modification protein DndC